MLALRKEASLALCPRQAREPRELEATLALLLQLQRAAG
jgi:hypothetical protein